jgi:hypothetical protein
LKIVDDDEVWDIKIVWMMKCGRKVQRKEKERSNKLSLS